MAGSIIITLALVVSLFSMIMYFLNYRGVKNTLHFARIAYHSATMFIIVASTYLLYLILTHQFQFLYVYSYSNNDLPLGYLISTFWAGQEGSFMLWLLMASIIGVFLQSYSAKRNDLEPRVMSVYALSISFLLMLVSPLLKNPFASIWSDPIFIDAKNINPAFFSLPFLQNFMFQDKGTGQHLIKMSSELVIEIKAAGISVNDFIIHGKGLNPLLQNFWMQIHPPILFAGFSLAAVPFTFAISSLMKNDYKDWIRQSFPWLLACASILGLGIMLGGYWAYGVLGWGGYWAWDPVENSSLVPWLIAVASIHTMLVQRKTQAAGNSIGRFAKTNLILCILVYVLVIYSTFLTRSGILGDSSVHSFVDPGTYVYLFLIIFLLTFLLLGLGLIVYRWKSLSIELSKNENIFSRELALFTAAAAVGASAIIVLVGTSAPIFGQSVEVRFYNQMHIPLAIIIGLLNGFSLLLKWNQTKGVEIFKKIKFSLVSTFAFTLLIIFLGNVYDIMMILLILASSFTLFVNLELAYKVIRGNPKMLGPYVTHIGFSIFILGVIGSSFYSEQKDIDLIKNQPKEIFGHKLEFTGYSPFDNNSKYAFNINVKSGNKEFSVKPVMYFSDFNNGLMREPDILEGFTKDFYISPLGYDDGTKEKNEEHAVTMSIGQEIDFEGNKIKYQDFIKPNMEAMMKSGDFQMGAKFEISNYGKTFDAITLMKKSGEDITYIPAEIKEANIKIELKNIDPASKQIELAISKLNNQNISSNEKKEILSVTASVKPFVSLVWFGTIILVSGFIVSMFRRLKESSL